jgi:hypothetical protein
MDSTAFPWFRRLTETGQVECLREMKKCLAATSGSWTQRLADLDAVLAAWKSTAEVYARPELHKALTEPSSGDYGPAPEPDWEPECGCGSQDCEICTPIRHLPGPVQEVAPDPGISLTRVILPRGIGVVEIMTDLVEGATGDPAIRVDVISDAARYGPAADGRYYEVIDRKPGPGVVALIGRTRPDETKG